MIRELKVGIVNYKCGNIASLQSSLKLVGHRSKLINNDNDFLEHRIIIIPGVGAFPRAMDQIKENGLIEGILRSAKEGKKIIGICLGMHLLAEKSYEFKETKGLGLIEGSVNYFSEGLQVGWMRIEQNSKLKNLEKFNKKEFYFNHEYILKGRDKDVLFYNNENEKKYPSIIKNRNIMGIQFHPEKSQTNGLKLLSELLDEN